MYFMAVCGILQTLLFYKVICNYVYKHTQNSISSFFFYPIILGHFCYISQIDQIKEEKGVFCFIFSSLQWSQCHSYHHME